MTEIQYKMANKIMEKHKLSSGSPETALIYLGLGYGLEEEEISIYLGMEGESILDKHLRMLCLILGMREPPSDGDGGGDGTLFKGSPAERLESILREHYMFPSGGDIPYGNVMHYILNESGLSAAQIEQLRLAVKSGMSEDEVMKMATGKKEPMEIKRCVEFYQMLRSGEAETKKRGGAKKIIKK